MTTFRVLVIFIMFLPGLLGINLYSWIVREDPSLVVGLFGAKQEVASVIAGYSFTMLGFLAAMITLLFSLSDRENFKRYKRKGHFGTLLLIYLLSIFNLVVLALLCLPSFSTNDFVLVFNAMLVFFVNSLTQISVMTVVICNLVKNST